MGYTEGVNNQTNICSAEGQAPFGSPDTSVFTDFVCVHARPEPEGARDGERHNDTSDECGGCNAWHDDCCGMAYEVARSNTCHMSGMGCPPETEQTMMCLSDWNPETHPEFECFGDSAARLFSIVAAVAVMLVNLV